MKKITAAVSMALGLLTFTNASASPLFADVVAIVDESGSMSGEHTWLGGMMTSLDSELVTKGLSSNQYGLVGFGGGTSGHANGGHTHTVGGSQFGTAAQFATATSGLVVTGSTEDGYSGIAMANSYSFRSGSARNYILVTDEDRDILSASPYNYTNILTSMTSTGTLLNAVINASFKCGDGSTALGMASGGTGYKADGLGGYTTCAGATAFSGSGSTIADYVNLALATGGAAWDLNQLRAGGNTAVSFTNAFVDLKVDEIQKQTVSEPGSIALIGLGLAGLLAARRRAKSE